LNNYRLHQKSLITEITDHRSGIQIKMITYMFEALLADPCRKILILNDPFKVVLKYTQAE